MTPIDEDLLWLENDGKPDAARWKMHRVAAENKADVFFDVKKFPRPDGSGTQNLIVVGSFYKQRLELIWSEDPDVSIYISRP